MGYRIVYGSGCKEASDPSEKGSRLKYYTGVALLLFSIIVNLYWPGGKQILQQIFLPGSPGVTSIAAENFLVQIRQGIGLEEALQTFCLEVLENEADEA